MTYQKLGSQYPLLGVKLSDHETFDNFYPGKNGHTLTQFKKSILESGESTTFLWGANTSGRSHLLHALCAEVSLQNRSVVYFSLKSLHKITLEILENLETTSLVCIDDIEFIVGDKKWEKALFEFYNRWSDYKNTHDARSSLILCANQRPSNLGLTLTDLVSRLEWGACYQLLVLDDEEKIAALQLRAKLRGIDLPLDVGQFLLKRVSREMGELLSVLDKLDNLSLEKKRKITIPFVKTVLAL